MISAICTLFEGHYHYGVAALSNSLYKNGFRGKIYVGYRGNLPSWASDTKPVSEFQWKGATTFEATDGLILYFLPLTTNYHLTNYKPDFMSELWDGPAIDADAMFYFDPDIVVNAPFSFFQDWVKCGVAVCEDVNSPLQEYHPKRVAWRQYYSKFDLVLNFKNQIYVNGGFLGLMKGDSYFLEYWIKCQELMALEIGGLNRSAFFKGDQLSVGNSGSFALFGKTDQDALNATLEVYGRKISYLNKEAMGFEEGLMIIPHALGQKKPWLLNPMKTFFNGNKLRIVDKQFWENVLDPIPVFSKPKVKSIKSLIKLTSFLNRFYSK